MHEANGGGIKGGGLGSRSGTGKPAGCALRAGSFFLLTNPDPLQPRHEAIGGGIEGGGLFN